jgi:flagellar biosynthesis repressor protein FlbT
VALKIELKPNERFILGDCVVKNTGQRAHLVIDGSLPILREKDIMSLGQANTPAKCIYLAVQFMYLAKNPRDNHSIYLQLAQDMIKNEPRTKPLIDRINNQILTGDLYKALKEAKKLIAYEKAHLSMNYAANAYKKIAVETASPRDLEANLLLQAAAKLQAAHDAWADKKTPGLSDALQYNRRLWSIFLDAVMSEKNRLPATVRENIRRLGVYTMAETFSVMTRPQPEHLMAMIKINRGIAAGLRAKA